MKDLIDFSGFLDRAFKASTSEILLKEHFSTAVRKPSRLSDTCLEVLIQNVKSKKVFKPVAINIDSSVSSFTSFSSVLVDFFWSRQKSLST